MTETDRRLVDELGFVWWVGLYAQDRADPAKAEDAFTELWADIHGGRARIPGLPSVEEVKAWKVLQQLNGWI